MANDRGVQPWAELETLPKVMPGENLPEWSVPYGAYDWNGQLLDTDPIAGGELMANWDARKDHQFRTALASPTYTFDITTTWLGMNHNHSGGIPLVWETMAQGSNGWLDFQIRYCTEAAAKNGHLRITEALISVGMSVTHTNVDVPELEP